MTPMNLTDDSSTADSANTVNTTIVARAERPAREIRTGMKGSLGPFRAAYRRNHATTESVYAS
jgi:hypothetical protein